MGRGLEPTGSIAFYIDGVKISEYNNIITAANNSPTITDIKMGGSIAQPAYDAPAHYRKFDALMLTDNWQDIVDGGYLKGCGDSTPPPTGDGSNQNTGGDNSSSSGGGCGFVKDDGKGQGAKGEGLSFAMMLIMAFAGIAIAKRISKWIPAQKLCGNDIIYGSSYYSRGPISLRVFIFALANFGILGYFFIR